MRGTLALCLVLGLSAVSFGGKKVNGRYAPSGDDGMFKGRNVVEYGMNEACSTLTEIHEMLGASRHDSTLTCKRITVDTINGTESMSITSGTVSDSLYADTLAGALGNITNVTSTSLTVSDSGYVDTLRTQSLRVADPIGIDSISFKDSGSDDTLVLKINGRYFFIYPTRQE